MHPRDRQLSASTMDSGVTSKSASLPRPSFDRGDTEEGGDDDGDNPLPPPPPMPEPDPAHPYPFNIIPAGTDFESRRSMQASCLSLAARSTRSSCQSLVPTDDDEVGKNRFFDGIMPSGGTERERERERVAYERHN